MRVRSIFAARFLLASTLLPAQTLDDALPATPMPPDRAADSYRLYAALMPLGETANKDWPHDLYLVQDTTVTLVSADQPCAPPPSSRFGIDMNPHSAIKAPEQYRQDLAEILADFDHHCHDRLTLDPDPKAWKLAVPIHLLNPHEQDEFRGTRGLKDSPTAEKFKGAPGLYAFSEVYFNAHHTVALVYATHWCGGLCGEGFWVAFTLDNGQWKSHSWSTTRWIA